MALGENHADDDEGSERRQIADAAIEARLGARHIRPGEANATIPALHMNGSANQRRKAHREKHGPARRNAEQAIERKAEIDQHEQADRDGVGQLGAGVGVDVKGQRPEPDQKC